MELRLVDFPEEFEAPPDLVLVRLREIDHRAELVGVGPGMWWAGIVKPFAERVEMGKSQLAYMLKKGRDKKSPRWWPKIRNAMLSSQGFGVVCKHRFKVGEVEWDLLVEDFRYRCWWYLQYEEGDEALRLAIEGKLDEDIRTKARLAVIESMHADRRYLFKRILQRNPAPVSVGVNL